MEDWKTLWHKVHRKYTGSSNKDFTALKAIVFKRDNNVCQTCGSNDILVCHHRSYKHFMDGGDIEAADCITLCKRCHMGIHKNGNTMKHFAEEEQEWLNEHCDEATKYVEPKPKKVKEPKKERTEEEKAWLRWYWMNKKRK